MARYVLLVGLLVGFYGNLSSQDLIITVENDTLNCKITKVKPDFIYFTFKHETEFRSTLLPILQVKTYQYNYFTQAEVPSDKIVGQKNYPQFVVGGYGGYSYMLAKVDASIPSEFQDYFKDLKSGLCLGAEASYFISEPIGIGFRFDRFSVSNSMSNVWVTDANGNTRTGNMSDEIAVTFLAPSITTRLIDKRRNSFSSTLALGYVGYRNNKELVDQFVFTGSTLGLGLDLAYDFRLNPDFLLYLQFSLLTGSLSEFKVDDGKTVETYEFEQGEYEGLGRINFTLGIKFSRFPIIYK